MVTTLIRWADTWHTLNPDTLRVMDAGAWTTPRLMDIRVNDAWVSTGYFAAPGTPASFRATGWSYNTVTLAWEAASGTPTASYEAQMLNESGAVLSTKPSTNTDTSFSVSTDTRYKFRVRALSAGGIQSPWSNEIRIGIGHPQVISQRWAQRAVGGRQWGKYMELRQGWTDGPTAPALNTATYGFAVGALITNIHLNIWCDTTSILHSPTRGCNWVVNGSGDVSTPNYALPRNADSTGDCWGVSGGPNWSNGGIWGLHIYGSGWGVNDSRYFLKGYVTIYGTEYYAELEDYVSTAAVGNYYY